MLFECPIETGMVVETHLLSHFLQRDAPGDEGFRGFHPFFRQKLMEGGLGLALEELSHGRNADLKMFSHRLQRDPLIQIAVHISRNLIQQLLLALGSAKPFFGGMLFLHALVLLCIDLTEAFIEGSVNRPGNGAFHNASGVKRRIANPRRLTDTSMCKLK